MDGQKARSIRLQVDKVVSLIDEMENTLSLGVLKEVFKGGDLESIRVPRPNGGAVDCVYLRSLVMPKDVQTEIVPRLEFSEAPLSTSLPAAVPVPDLDNARAKLVAGYVVILSGEGALGLDLARIPKRPVDIPETERALFGAKDSFVENLDDNLALVREHIRDPNLRVERFSIGTHAPTPVAVLSLTGSVDTNMLEDVLSRLASFHPQRMGFVSSLLRPLFGETWSPFLRAEFTERPERAADQLVRGRIAILAQGSPFAMVIPQVLDEAVKDDESEFQSVLIKLFVRSLRIIGLAGATLFPGLYMALLTVNASILPSLLASEVALSRQAIPYPVFTESFMLLVVLDILSESTISMKGVLGPAISIVGTLIIGQAAVRANLASNLSVILVAVTALGTYITPRFHLTYAFRIWKYPIFFLSAIFGIIGWTLGVLLLLTHLAGIRTLGISYLTPWAPLLPGTLATQSSVGMATPQQGKRMFTRRPRETT